MKEKSIPLRCYFGFHRMPRWSDPRDGTATQLDSYGNVMLDKSGAPIRRACHLQFRICPDCNEQQLREVK